MIDLRTALRLALLERLRQLGIGVVIALFIGAVVWGLR